VTEDDSLVAALAGQTGLTVCAPALGLGAGRHPVVFFALSELDDEAVDRLIADHLDDDVLAALPAAFVRGPDGLRRWARTDVEPFGVVGGPETFQLGPDLVDALPAAAVLLRDRDGGAVLGWDRIPGHAPVAVAASLTDLDVV
jgi:hypothetical protein